MSVGEQVAVGKGGTFDADGLSFGGSYHLPATDTESERVIVAVWDEKTSSQKFELRVGEMLEFAGQTWRLDEIDDSQSRWYALLTRTA